MTTESIQHKLDRVRPPRVQITYDVEIGGAIERKELPLVVGVLADLSGHASDPLPALRERKFVEIDRDNFNEVMAAIGPRLALRVPNRLDPASNSQLNVELRFRQPDDFSPVPVIEQVEPLRKLFEARGRLSDLLSKMDGNDKLETLLAQASQNSDDLKNIQAAIAGGANGQQ
ncbi:MAG: type VI secretion system contractile sheath small subunit [Bryobacteraceae bacterium]